MPATTRCHDRFAETLVFSREATVLSHKQVADACGVDVALVARWELGAAYPDTHHHHRLESVLRLGRGALRRCMETACLITRALVEARGHTVVDVLEATALLPDGEIDQFLDGASLPPAMFSDSVVSLLGIHRVHLRRAVLGAVPAEGDGGRLFDVRLRHSLEIDDAASLLGARGDDWATWETGAAQLPLSVDAVVAALERELSSRDVADASAPSSRPRPVDEKEPVQSDVTTASPREPAQATASEVDEGPSIGADLRVVDEEAMAPVLSISPGSELRNTRVRAGMTREQLAGRARVRLRYLIAWERDEAPMNRESRRRLEQVLGTKLVAHRS